MNWEKLKQIILKHPHLIKITPTVLSSPVRLLKALDLDYSKTYGEQGLDDLDLIEMVMCNKK